MLGLVNDPAHAVEVYVDADVWARDRWNCHPLINTQTLVLAKSDVEKFLKHTGHEANIIKLESRE